MDWLVIFFKHVKVIFQKFPNIRTAQKYQRNNSKTAQNTTEQNSSQ